MEHYPSPLANNIPVVILAGGQSNRLKVDHKLKWQLSFDDETRKASPSDIYPKTEQTLLAFIIKRLKLQTDCILINGPFIKNKDLNQYKLPIIDDSLADFQGPLSGILTALSWAKNNHQPWVVTVSCDSPFFPDHLLQTLARNLNGKKAAIAMHNTRTHPTFGLWSVALYESLKNAVEVEHIRAVNRWALQYSNTVEFKAKHTESMGHSEPIDPFFNINTLADYQQALSHLSSVGLGHYLRSTTT